jgi:hypothetical protein
MSRRVRGPGRGPLESGAVGIDWFLLVSSAARGRKKNKVSLLSFCVFSREPTRKEKKKSPPPVPFRAHLSSPRARSSHPTRKLATTGKKRKTTKRFLPFPIAFREEKIPRSLSYTRRSFFFSPCFGKKNLGGREQTQKKPKEHTRTLIPSARVILRVRVRTQQIGQVVHASQQSIVDVRNFEV